MLESVTVYGYDPAKSKRGFIPPQFCVIGCVPPDMAKVIWPSLYPKQEVLFDVATTSGAS